MLMTRALLVETVRVAARKAGLIETDVDSLVAAVSNPSVARIARGTYGPSGDSDNCPVGCPATLAFGGTTDAAMQSYSPTITHDHFAQAFDTLTADLLGISRDGTAPYPERNIINIEG